MSIQELGSIGEIVGAIAVVISLIYLAIQVRQNTAVRRVEAFRGAVEDFSKFRHMLIQHPELTELGRKSINEFSESEKARFELLIEELAWASNGLFYFVQKG